MFSPLDCVPFPAQDMAFSGSVLGAAGRMVAKAKTKRAQYSGIGANVD